MNFEYDDELIKIENLKGILQNFVPETYHPDDPRWLPYWRDLKKKMIEGIWVEQFGKLRYVSGRLGFYGVFFRFTDWDEDKTRINNAIPKIRDIEFHRANYRLESSGFSGWENDSKYTSDQHIFELKKNFVAKIGKKRESLLYTSDGKFKEFIPARENIFMLHNREGLGPPLYYNNALNHIELGSRGGGKSTPLSEPVLTSKGWRTMGDIKLGDMVINRYGNKVPVIQIHPQGKRQVWEVTLSDGRKVNCSDNHLWTVRKNSGIESTISTVEMYNQGLFYPSTNGNVFKFRVPNCEPIPAIEKEFPLDPYVLGYLLGNGCLTTRTPKVASSDEFVMEEFNKRLTGFTLAYDSFTNNNYTIVDNEKCELEITKKSNNKYIAKIGNRLTQILENLGINKSCKDKFIPEMYKYGSIEQRLELVRGLLDSDGSVNKDGATEFTNTCKQLVDDLVSVCRSLGINCIVSKDNREGEVHNIKGYESYRGICYRVYINTTLPIFKLPRKLNKLINNKKKTLRQSFNYIKSIVPTNRYEEQQCISVGSRDQTYITTDYVVTHNSYFTAGAELLYDFIFDNLKRYEPGKKYNSIAELEVTSAMGGDATELLKKVQYGMDALNDPENSELGVFIYPSGKIEPCYFYKKTMGSIEPNNKSNPWAHTKKVKQEEGGQGFEKKTKSYIVNTTTSPNVKTGGLKSAGGRRTFIVYEEIGKNVLLLKAWGNNEGTVSEAGVKFASQKAIGTSGDLETVQSARQIFEHTDLYKALQFKYKSDPKIKYGWFLSVAMVDPRFKDEDGNTDLEAAIAYHTSIVEEMEKSGASADIILNYKMNNPLTIEDMWFGGGGTIMPVQEAKTREAQLLKGNLYETIGTKISFEWDTTSENGVKYNLNPKGEPFYQFPIPSTVKNLAGSYTMYVHPDKLKINGVIPRDAVITLIDPYVADEWDRGESLGCILHFCNPKYCTYGLPGGKLLASYHGKPVGGTDEFATIAIQGHAFYGNCVNTLWYEANKGGEKIRSAAIKHKRFPCLALEPQFENGHQVFVKASNRTGYIIGGSGNHSLNKRVLWGDLAQLLVQTVTWKQGDEAVEYSFLDLIDDIYLVRQIKEARLDLNVDAVSAMQALPLSLNEQEFKALNKDSGKNLIGLKNIINKLRAENRRRSNHFQRNMYND